MRAHARPASRIASIAALSRDPRQIAVACRLRHVTAMTSDRFRQSAAVRASVSADGLVLLDVHGGEVLASNPVGAQIWQRLDGQLTRSDIAREVAHLYGVPLHRAEHDVVAFIAALAARGLVTEVPA